MEPRENVDPDQSWPRDVKAPDRSNFHQDTYSQSQFDVIKVLSCLARRPNPRIDLGPIDCSAAMIVCDMYLEDNPIVYCSEAFCDLTGYNYSDVLGRNCRFLQVPGTSDDTTSRGRTPGLDKISMPGAPSQTVDLQHELHRLKHSLSHKEEVQAMLLNYHKSGRAFLNLVTVVPVETPGDDHQYLVGFQAASRQVE
ncbi:related to vivid PAS protein VVD [Ramularia collo-cygni]|uniref:Related to vivid PAS protein VVD n=1 Tax=Ramularia collo-cygni TaxID=112498 RepID=A0A2D3UXP3_9PEZI|nr:related to vivid PAS protein VVD [Ramularia collo-cygni]CZT20198.1 related to vivid PAS protein VVD [Ramularia collo-cygni]